MSRPHGVNPKDYARQRVFEAARTVPDANGMHWGRMKGESWDDYKARLKAYYEAHPEEAEVPMICTCDARPYAHYGHPWEEWRWID